MGSRYDSLEAHRRKILANSTNVDPTVVGRLTLKIGQHLLAFRQTDNGYRHDYKIFDYYDIFTVSTGKDPDYKPLRFEVWAAFVSYCKRFTMAIPIVPNFDTGCITFIVADIVYELQQAKDVWTLNMVKDGQMVVVHRITTMNLLWIFEKIQYTDFVKAIVGRDFIELYDIRELVCLTGFAEPQPYSIEVYAPCSDGKKYDIQYISKRLTEFHCRTEIITIGEIQPRFIPMILPRGKYTVTLRLSPEKLRDMFHVKFITDSTIYVPDFAMLNIEANQISFSEKCSSDRNFYHILPAGTKLERIGSHKEYVTDTDTKFVFVLMCGNKLHVSLTEETIGYTKGPSNEWSKATFTPEHKFILHYPWTTDDLV